MISSLCNLSKISTISKISNNIANYIAKSLQNNSCVFSRNCSTCYEAKNFTYRPRDVGCSWFQGWFRLSGPWSGLLGNTSSWFMSSPFKLESPKADANKNQCKSRLCSANKGSEKTKAYISNLSNISIVSKSVSDLSKIIIL